MQNRVTILCFVLIFQKTSDIISGVFYYVKEMILLDCRNIIKTTEERDTELINMILDYAIKNHMSFKEIDKCIEKIEEVYYSDGVVIRD
ncbi:hypothetical protein [Alkaliphilus hydrothermalis]|uniref:Uncharacterized protein n=1 Tax=Alkaliphilus hydrothermalis TaxID=1482730 RepID=A0ABS2NMI7_9FIRM|nr:hypothetical protein [Alkaliphilus hydrothermalis]MBM7614140.1 hypothetical protein [Alkaliphilus hydrothermalis]